MSDVSIVINNNARNAELADKYIQALMDNNIQINVFKVAAPDLNDTIEKAITSSDIVLVGGGDGTIRTSAEKCAGSNKILGVLPLGTLNHFAKELQLPLTTEEVVQALQQKNTTQIDLGTVNDHIFINNASIGFYAHLASERKFYSSFINKWLSYIPGFFKALINHKRYHFVIKNNDSSKLINTAFLLVSNNVYTFKFPASFERESFYANRLGLYYITDQKLFRRFLNRFILKNSKFTSLEIESDLILESLKKSPIKIALDGDLFNVSSPLVFKSLPKSLRVLTLT